MSAISQILSRSGALTAGDLYRRLSPDVGTERSFQRAIKADPHVVRLGRGNRSVYALRLPSVDPVAIVLRDEDGVDRTVATLFALAAGQWAVESTPGAPVWLAMSGRDGMPGVFQGLPWFLDSLRPAGFLGRAWVRDHAAAHGWTIDVNAWTDEQVISAAVQQPWDWRGNLGVAHIASAADPVFPVAERKNLYAQRAALVLNGEMVGASADGEQPKFTAVIDDGDGGPPRSVLVKFSPPLSDSPAAQRWGDIMVTEGIAAQMMTLHGMHAASTLVWRHDDRIWLETTRFDRVGAAGRRGMTSLRALAQSFGYTGPQNGWVNAVEHLERRGVLSLDQLDETRRLATIGHLIANTDMHMGNLSFLLSAGKEPFLSIAPAYDMAPMRWVPGSTSGRVPGLEMEALPYVEDREALVVAREIWREAAAHALVTPAWAAWSTHRAIQIQERIDALDKALR